MKDYCNGLSAIENESDLMELGFKYIGHLPDLYGDDTLVRLHLARKDNMYVIYFDQGNSWCKVQTAFIANTAQEAESRVREWCGLIYGPISFTD